MRNWRLQIGSMEKWRYEELKAVCRQYRQATEGDPGTRSWKIRQAACETAGGRWTKALIKNCCQGVRYEHLDAEDLWSSSRNAYFAARREFFERLDRAI